MNATTVPASSSFGRALIASPDSVVRAEVSHRLAGRFRSVQQALGGADALAELERGEWQVLFLDRHLPDLDTDEVSRMIQKRFPKIQVVLIDSEGRHADEPSRVPAANSLPVLPTTPQKRVAIAQDSPHSKPLPGMIGDCPAMQRVYRLARLVAGRPTTVLVAGPTGTGKELMARALHTLSSRASKPFIVINCAAIPEALLESELFGYSRGAFTGAVQSQLGRIPAAHGGTLFLDEISELPLGMQAKLLRFLEQKEIQRLGMCEVTKVDVRVIAASNVDLAERAAHGCFRQDLFYRLSAFPIELPCLSERKPDIVPLAEHFLSCMAAALGTETPRLSPEAIDILEAHDWRGNVRELQHVMERASILVEDGNVIETSHLYFPHAQSTSPATAAEALEKTYSSARQLA
jgi:DNA-binding NtrC family response regulator